MTHRQKVIIWSIVLLALSMVGLNVDQKGHADLPQIDKINPPGYHDVFEVIDGDTIKVNLGGKAETVRLLGVDTPETHDPRKPVQCFGLAATEFSKGLMAGKPVRLEADPADSGRDKYYRLLRYVYLSDGRLVNTEIIRQGYGFAYTVFPLAKLDEFRNLELEAKQNNRGLWNGCAVDETQTVKQTK